MSSLVTFTLLLALYFLPSLVAFGRGTANRYSVLVLNTALGWTILGWVIFLAMSVSGAKVRA